MTSKTNSSEQWGAYSPSGFARAILWLTRRTFLGRGSPRRLMFRLFGMFHSGPVDIVTWETPVRLYPQINVSERKALLRPDQVDPLELTMLRQAMRDEGATFVDVGGNAGIYSLNAALDAAPSARIVMIEPDPNMIARFAFNVTAARQAGRIRATDAQVSTLAIAISDHNGSGILDAGGDEGSRGLLSGGAAETGRVVQLKTLSDVVADEALVRIDVLKIDVEGHEDKVLPPFFLSAKRELWPRLIIIEHLQRSDWEPDAIAAAENNGYRIVRQTRNNTILERSTHPNTI